MTEALLAFGGNVGDVRTTLDLAVRELCDGVDVRLLARSSDYLTPPWGMTDQPPFVNLCIAVETDLSPHALLERARVVEQRFGRDRTKEVRWGPRPIDIDLLNYDDVEINEPELQVPHPRMLERAFVLVPLAEIAPDRIIKGIAIRDAVAKLDTGDIKLLPPNLIRLI
jgi:2-amino-4-hydroxy-6-hydroxymethyldihydropteridine diphosphokinase